MIRHAISLLLALFGLWLVLSGHFNPLLLALGAISAAFVTFLALRMEVVDQESYPFNLTTRLLRFWAWLFKEIVLSNIDVTKRVLTGRISPRMVKVPAPQQTDLGLAIYANAITLTPGTVSIEVTSESIEAHALSKEGAEGLAEGTMAEQVPEPDANTEKPR